MIRDIAERTFTDQKVELDGYNFIRCTFENCDLLLTAEREFALNDCVFTNSRFRFGGPAMRTVALVQAMRAQGIEILREPQRPN